MSTSTLVGSTLGRWRIEARAGAGPVAEVFRAADAERPGEFVALKRFTAAAARAADFPERLRDVAKPLAGLKHPHVARVLEVGSVERLPCWVAQWADGTGLDALSRRHDRGRLPWADVLEAAIQVVPALRYAHRKGILHGNLKPSNLIRSDAGVVSLTDFGVTRLIARQPDDPSPLLDAPEAALGKPVTRRSDLYTLGGVLYTLLTGRPPFLGKSAVEVTHKHCYAVPERVENFVPGVPRELGELVLRLLAKDPAHRPADAGVLLKQLEAVRADLERRGLVGPRVPPVVSPVEGEPVADEVNDSAPYTPVVLPPDPPVPWTRRPAVMIPLALAVFGGTAWGLLSGPGVAGLRDRVGPLLASADPDDWQRAFDEGLGDLASRDPAYLERAADLRQKLDDRAAQRRALAAGRLLGPAPTVAERMYRRGLALCAQGDLEAARRDWLALVASFESVPEASRWAELAKEGADSIGRAPGAMPPTPEADAGVRAARARAAELRAAGREDEARRVEAGLP